MTNDPVQHFNLQTMSGVYAGTRTPIFQRVQIEQANPPPFNRSWLQLAWVDEPPACVAYAVQPGTAIDDEQPLLRIADPLAGDFNQQLQSTLAARRQRLVSCGSCRFWQAGNVVTPDRLPAGSCHWQATATPSDPLPATLAMQSSLALPCPHWQSPHHADPDVKDVVPAIRQSLAPMRKVAEGAEIRLTLWQRLWKRLRARWWAGQPLDWERMFLERSGVGAGTEPCFVCQARIANLGALTVETPEGDKQTFSIWRCRHCYTVYLNNWIDRWERLDNLETEETYYRLAPAEAQALLQVIYGVVGGEHPHRRQEREQERIHFLNFITGRNALSHQIRQGR